MRALLFLPAILLFSCSGSSDKSDKPMTWEDSVIKNTNVKIEKLEKSGDSIEHVNTSGERKLK